MIGLKDQLEANSYEERMIEGSTRGDEVRRNETSSLMHEIWVAIRDDG
jgi:hypothetical protein